MKKYLLILFSIAITSCSSKKVITETKHTSDTIYKDREIIKTEKIVDSFEVKVPCNEKNEIKPFNQRIKTSGGFVHVWTDNGTIKAKMLLEPTKNETVKEYKTKYVYVDKNKEVIKYRMPFYCYLIIVLSIIILFLYLRTLFS